MYVKPQALKGRGAISNNSGRYEVTTLHTVDDGWQSYVHPSHVHPSHVHPSPQH